MKNPVVHFEIGCPDSEASKAFYGAIFDWKITQEEHSLAIDTGVKGGITGHITTLGHEPHKYINVYVQVEDIEATFIKIEANGGKRLVGPIPLPTGISFGWFEDVAGNTVGLVTERKEG